jgi:hypothetical protein
MFKFDEEQEVLTPLFTHFYNSRWVCKTTFNVNENISALEAF